MEEFKTYLTYLIGTLFFSLFFIKKKPKERGKPMYTDVKFRRYQELAAPLEPVISYKYANPIYSPKRTKKKYYHKQKK